MVSNDLSNLSLIVQGPFNDYICNVLRYYKNQFPSLEIVIISWVEDYSKYIKNLPKKSENINQIQLDNFNVIKNNDKDRFLADPFDAYSLATGIKWMIENEKRNEKIQRWPGAQGAKTCRGSRARFQILR